MKKLLENIRSSYWLRSGIFSFAQKFSVLAFGVGSFLLLVRFISEEQMGIWALYLSVTTIFEQARSGLLRNGLIRYLNTNSSHDEASVQTASLVLNGIASIMSVGMILIIAQAIEYFWNTPVLTNILYWHCPYVILLIPFLHYEFIQQAKANFHYVFYSYAIRQGVFFLCILLGILVFENLTLKQLVYFQIFSLLVSLPFAHYYAKKLLGFTKIKNFKLVMELWRYGKYVLGTNISSLIYRNTDHFMLASMVSSTAVAYYNVAVRVSNLVDLPSTVAAEALFPKSAEASTKINKDEQLKNLYEKTVGMTLSLVIPTSIIILVFPKLIITLLAGEAYIKSASILQVTILYGLLLPFARQFGTLMDSIGHPHQNFYLVFSMAILNFCFNYLFITYYGDIGAAYGTLATYLFGFVTCQIILKKTLGVTMKNIIVNIFHSYYLLFIRIKGKPTNKLVK